ncbi:MAG: head-tail connector protein [Elusimicrobiales bacterium]
MAPPTEEPVSLAEAKNHLRVDVADDDGLISALIAAAREYCEAFQNRAYVTQTWQLWLDAWPEGNEIRIPRPPLQAVNAIKYYGADGAEYTLAPADYLVDTQSEPGRLVLAPGRGWPSVTLRPASAVCVEFVAGYGAPNKVPQRVKQAILLLVGHWYDTREIAAVGRLVNEVPFTVNALLWQERVVPV